MSLVRVKGRNRVIEKVVLTPDQMLTVRENLEDPYLLMAERACYLGLRICEVLGLMWDDFDPEAKTCSVNVTLVVESLALPNLLIRSQTMSEGFLDPAQYPTQHYVGTCQGDTLVGNLTMRGQTHPFNMTITNEVTNGQLTGLHLEGKLNRYDWGLNGLGMTVGKVIRVTNDISLNGQPPVPPAS